MSHRDLPQTGNHDAPLDELCQNAIELVEYARNITEKQISAIQLMTFYSIGRWIVEVQQNGDSRAQYGKQVLKKLSATMTEKFGRGFSVDNLENMRRFYLTYRERISEKMFRIFAMEKSETISRILEEDKPFTLSFSHYLILCRIKDNEERAEKPSDAVKDPYVLEFLGLKEESSYAETELETRIIDH